MIAMELRSFESKPTMLRVPPEPHPKLEGCLLTLDA